jgi:SAM-dependent methyltransferase
VTLGEAWEANASDWIAWARTQNHDGFWEGTWPELEAVLPDPLTGPVVEIGCGEGRVGRKLIGLGADVIGVELSATLAASAAAGPLRLPVLRADGANLPIANAVVPVIVACMSLHDVDDLGGTVQECARILRSGGSLCIALVHPMASAQDVDTMHTDAPRISGPYLTERRYVDEMERDGLHMRFISVHRPLGVYMSQFSRAGLFVEELREFGNKPIPWLLTARLKKLGGAVS